MPEEETPTNERGPPQTAAGQRQQTEAAKSGQKTEQSRAENPPAQAIGI